MNESLEELKAIIDNAPSDATHACIENGTHYQFKVIGLNAEIYTGDGWLGYSGCALPDLCGVRLISDIKRIIELTELLGDIQGLGFLEESSDSGVSHRAVCRRAKQLQGVQ